MRFTEKKKSLVFFIAFISLLSACSSSPSPVSVRTTIDRNAESEKLGGPIITIVQPGDTWYGIAFANNLNVSELAAWNGLTSNDTLFSGQRVRLTEPPGFKMPVEKPQLLDVPIVSNSSGNSNSSSIPTQARESIIVSARQANPTSNNTVKSPQSIASTGAKKNDQKPSSSGGNQVVSALQQAAPKEFPKVVNWQWPIKGQIVSKYSPNTGRKGIDIAAKEGQEIKVAAPGRVVYQGNGIKGYNNLIIIKHNEELLSAYAHSQQVFVREGQWINAGQTISTVGLKNGKPVLHFEIRKKGQPVNPLGYLGA